jgi:vacuolar-type H+-ATPase subunit H
MLNKARTTSEQLLCQARAKADGMVTKATTRAETLLTDARARAETLDRQSREKAASLQRDAARQHTEIIGSISQEKTILEKKIDDLRTFEHEYRTRLATYLDSQLRELDRRGSTALTDPTRNQHSSAASSAPGTGAEPGNHHDPKIGTAGAGARLPARNEAPDAATSDEPGTSGIRWKPAVERGVTEPWAPVQRSAS